MAKFVVLTMEVGPPPSDRSFGDEDHTGEDDGIGAAAPAVLTSPVGVDPDEIREFYPRKGDRVGTRLVYKNGAGRPVTEPFEEVLAKFNRPV